MNDVLYMDKLREALEMDGLACAEAKAKRYAQSSEKFRKAAVLYAEAAGNLLDLMNQVDASEQDEYQRSVDRLIEVSGQMKSLAAEAAERAGRETGAKVNPDNDDEEEFVPNAETPETCFQDIIGLNEAKQIVADEIINPVLYKKVYQKFKQENHGGLLLFGPPGGGKTMMARAIAAESGFPFFSIRCSDIVGRYFGDAEKKVRALFKAVRAQKNAVVFLDEAEALASRRGSNSTVMNRLVPELLSQMDGFERFDGHHIVVFATNRPYDLDPAFLRPGRLATHCYVPLPDYQTRLELLRKEISERPCEGEIDTEMLARRTERFSCADLINLISKGCQRPINREIEAEKENRPEVDERLTQADLEQALEKVHPSVETEELRRLQRWMKQMGIRSESVDIPEQ